MTKSQIVLPSLAVLGSIISLCVGTSCGKSLFATLGPSGTASVRVIFAAFILVAFFKPWRQPLTRDAAKLIAVYGVVLACMNSAFYEAIQRLPFGIAIAIEFTGPLLVAIASSRRIVDFVWILFAIIGLAFLLPITPGAVSLDPLGILFAFTAASLWGTYIIVGKKMAKIPAGQATSLGVVMAGLVLLPVGIVKAGAHLLNPQILLASLFLSIASSAVPYTLEMYAMRKLPKNTFSILLSMEPAIGALSGMVVLHEYLTMQQWGAVLSVMIASIGSTVTARNTRGDESGQEKVIAADMPADVL